MSYRIRFRARAKAELLLAKQYSVNFSEQLDAWLTEIASGCEHRNAGTSIDLIDLLKKARRSRRTLLTGNWPGRNGGMPSR